MNITFFAAILDPDTDPCFYSHADSCRGNLMDRLRSNQILLTYSVIPQTLVCAPEDLKVNEDICVFKDRNARDTDPWYASDEKACEAYGKEASIDSLELHVTDVTPTFSFPHQVYLKSGKKGLQTRLEIHPEENGFMSHGKYFFPDKNCPGICEGTVEITGISKEFENYGFFTGHMVNFEAESPSYAEVLDWAWENRDNLAGARFITVKHPARGTYFVMQNSICGKEQYLRFVAGEDRIELVDLKERCDLTDEYIRENLPLRDFLIHGTFDTSPDELWERFTLCSFRTQPMTSRWLRSGRLLPSEIVEDGIDQGVLVALELEGLGIVRVDVNYDKIVELCAFTNEEVEEMVKAVNGINLAADIAIKNSMKKGKLKYTTSRVF